MPATLSLTLGTPASFGAVHAGRRRRLYNASATANVISTAGDALLSVADPSSTATGHLVNGAFSLPVAADGAGPQRGQHGHGVQQRRLLGQPAEPADLVGAGLQ